jgi:hypothetical protein
MPLLLFVHADHATAIVRAVAAREARFKGETAGAREAAASAAGAREATWSLVRLLLVQLLNMRLPLVHEHLLSAGPAYCCAFVVSKNNRFRSHGNTQLRYGGAYIYDLVHTGACGGELRSIGSSLYYSLSLGIRFQTGSC